jgi:lipopolysaccharide/colanic/teichoic acid biosynthesis glycosyltransferase
MRVGSDAMKQHLGEANEADGPIFKIKRDPRITPVGRILRKLSIDELPQLVHVLRGHMSLVGFRPPLADEFEQYCDWERQRVRAKPGLTCIWQVSGRSDLDFGTWVKMDLEYIERWSLWLDIKILLLTIPAVLSGRGAY